MKFLWCFPIIWILISYCDSARIFGFFPIPSISHQVVFHALVGDLAARGHQLTVLTTDLMKSDNPNITQIDLHGSYNTSWGELNLVKLKMEAQDEDPGKKIFRIHSEILDWQLSQPEVQAIIKKASTQQFDVVIVELMIKSVALAFGELFDCPIIAINSMDAFGRHHELMGNEFSPITQPELRRSNGQSRFMRKVKNVLWHMWVRSTYVPFASNLNNDLLHKHFPELEVSIDDLETRIQLLMVNVNPALGFIRQLAPNTVQLGFMHIQPPKTLPDGDLKTFLDNSRNGVIYLSLGSNVKCKDLSSETIQIFLEVFAELEFDVLWKFEDETLDGKPDNVMISKWLPQQDLLAHPSVKLFITQGGLQSMEEAIDRTIPLIVIPFVLDQNSNALRMVEKGIGHNLDLQTLTKSKLVESIYEMMKPQYKANIKKLREQVYDQPMNSRERAVWWTEYVIRHRNLDHLKHPSRLVPLYEQCMLDLIGIVIIVVTVLVAALSYVARKLILKFTKKIKKD